MGFGILKATNVVVPDSARGKISIKVTNGDNASDSKPKVLKI
jgi:hypothetical protein